MELVRDCRDDPCRHVSSWDGPAEQVFSVPATSTLRSILPRPAIVKLSVGWGGVVLMVLGRSLVSDHPHALAIALVLAAIVAVIITCAFGVVTQAEALAHRLGDPYGTLVLTLSIMVIEVILIAAVMLGPGDHATIARDSVMAATLIVLALIIGVSVLVGGTRHGGLVVNQAGVSTYLAYLVVLLAVAFAFPAVVGVGGAYTTAQAWPVLVLIVVLYGYFLYRQTGAQSGDFQEVVDAAAVDAAVADGAAERAPIAEVFRQHRAELIGRASVLIATVVPIVVLSHDMAALLDDGLSRLGAPVALSGLLIALIVFMPETLTTVRAAWMGEGQRMSNLAHGALVSCVGLTLPVVLAIGLATGQTVVLAPNAAGFVLLGVAIALNIATFMSRRVSAAHGAAHVLVFVLYVMAVFA
jgi:Ca2+:H+ antiporter